VEDNKLMGGIKATTPQVVEDNEVTIPRITIYTFPTEYTTFPIEEERSPKTQEQRQFCDPKRRSRTRVNDGDVLLTIARDLRNIREGIINRCTSRATLCRVDTLIDNLENYMAEN
jgi:hypothetical protein